MDFILIRNHIKKDFFSILILFRESCKILQEFQRLSREWCGNFAKRVDGLA